MCRSVSAGISATDDISAAAARHFRRHYLQTLPAQSPNSFLLNSSTLIGHCVGSWQGVCPKPERLEEQICDSHKSNSRALKFSADRRRLSVGRVGERIGKMLARCE